MKGLVLATAVAWLSASYLSPPAGREKAGFEVAFQGAGSVRYDMISA